MALFRCRMAPEIREGYKISYIHFDISKEEFCLLLA